MAEYIDRTQIKYHKDTNNHGYVFEYAINNLPKADVIERSKIDKAIKEIKAESFNEERTYPERIDSSLCEDIQIVDLQDVLEILERNIGE